MNIIECNQLTKSYGQLKALDHLSITIQENKITGLIGRNGAGKTTLLKILAGYWRETSGEAKVFSEKPFDNLNISANTIFIDDQQMLFIRWQDVQKMIIGDMAYIYAESDS